MTFLKKIINKIRYLTSSADRQKSEENIFFNQLYESLKNNNEYKKRVDYILTINENDPRLVGRLSEHDRALPGNANFLENGWYKSMLTRYALAMYYAKDKEILETCSGLGWGAYLLDAVAEKVTCVELDEGAIKAAEEIWHFQRCNFIQGSVLDLPFPENSFEIVTAMESIEHFTLKDAQTYRDERYRVLKHKGRLVGSTPLPTTTEEIKQQRQNPSHLHIFTPSKLTKFLQERFRDVHLFSNNRYFWAIK